jgi:SHAQKYF class myb-like DNA-binding protein
MGLPGLDCLPPTSAPSTSASSSNTVSFSSEDPHKKVRKPYTITKSRESWSDQEHDKFLEALQLFDRDWKKIEAFVGSKTVIQIRSHAQKYFMKVQKNGTSEHVPPPRPKRKAAHPYPQKAPKSVASHVNIPFQPSAALVEPGYIYRPDSSSVVDNPCTGAALSSWSFNSAPPAKLPQQTKDDAGSTILLNNSNSSTESVPRTQQTGKIIDRKDPSEQIRVMPDFGQVYSFIGSVFDPNESGHFQRLRQMDPINMETVLLLMRNLTINLTSPQFEHHRRLLLSYGDSETGKESSGSHVGEMQKMISSV